MSCCCVCRRDNPWFTIQSDNKVTFWYRIGNTERENPSETCIADFSISPSLGQKKSNTERHTFGNAPNALCATSAHANTPSDKGGKEEVSREPRYGTILVVFATAGMAPEPNTCSDRGGTTTTGIPPLVPYPGTLSPPFPVWPSVPFIAHDTLARNSHRQSNEGACLLWA